MVQQQKLDAQRDGTHSLLFIKSPDVNWMTPQDTPPAIHPSLSMPTAQICSHENKQTPKDRCTAARRAADRDWWEFVLLRACLVLLVGNLVQR